MSGMSSRCMIWIGGGETREPGSGGRNARTWIGGRRLRGGAEELTTGVLSTRAFVLSMFRRDAPVRVRQRRPRSRARAADLRGPRRAGLDVPGRGGAPDARRARVLGRGGRLPRDRGPVPHVRPRREPGDSGLAHEHWQEGVVMRIVDLSMTVEECDSA